MSGLLSSSVYVVDSLYNICHILLTIRKEMMITLEITHQIKISVEALLTISHMSYACDMVGRNIHNPS